MRVTQILAAASRLIQAFSLHPRALRVRGVIGKTDLTKMAGQVERFEARIARKLEEIEAIRTARNKILTQLDDAIKHDIRLAKAQIVEEYVRNDFVG